MSQYSTKLCGPRKTQKNTKSMLNEGGDSVLLKYFPKYAPLNDLNSFVNFGYFVGRFLFLSYPEKKCLILEIES